MILQCGWVSSDEGKSCWGGHTVWYIPSEVIQNYASMESSEPEQIVGCWGSLWYYTYCLKANVSKYNFVI